MPTTRTFHIRGAESTDRGDSFTPPKGEIKLKQRSITLGASRGEPDQMPELAADEVVRVELDNGAVFWSRADDLMRERGNATAHRGGTPSWDIAFAPPRGIGASRGWVQFGIKVLDVFGFDLAERTAAGLGTVFERKLLRNDAGVYRCPLDKEHDGGPDLQLLPADDDIPASDKPLLVFIHGTASHCGGSFGKLWASDNPAGATLRGRLHERYGDRVYALEHRSLTESPISNALALVHCLPKGAELHLVTHSRGGLVGELLCLGHRARNSDDESNGDPLSDKLIKDLFAADRTMAEQLGLGPLDEQASKERDAAYDADRANLALLRQQLDDKGIRVTRFVRAACPARGTTLASGRLDRWLSVLDMLSGNGLFGGTIDFLLAVVQERTDPRTLPGIEAMMPGSALTLLLAQPALRVDADLSVIAGDIEGDSLFGQIKLLAVDWFYDSDHDLVVNTGSMSGGLRRTEGNARFRIDRGAHVSHFNYFHNRGSVQWLEQGLTRADGDDGGFMPIGGAPAEQPRWREAVSRSQDAGAPRPIAVVLPGTMGSSLKVDEEHIWLNYRKLLGGGLNKIRAGRTGVKPIDLLDDFYGPLLDYLSGTHRVNIFPYDWRESVFDAATALTGELEPLVDRAERENQPLHLVAHSMGGLVVRAMIADGGRGSALWQRIRELDNSRFLMLGTPNHGSHEAVRWLVGRNPTELKLALLDMTRGLDGVIDIVRKYPGLVELLPFAPSGTNFADPNLWKDLQQELGAKWNTVPMSVLRKAQRSWDRLLDAEPDPGHMIYVAGCQPETVIVHAENKFPDELNLPDNIPLYKESNTLIASKYSLISITCAVAKNVEYVLKGQVNDFLKI